MWRSVLPLLHALLRHRHANRSHRASCLTAAVERIWHLQRYLAHEKQSLPRTLQQVHAYGPWVFVGGGVLLYERGTPVTHSGPVSGLGFRVKVLKQFSSCSLFARKRRYIAARMEVRPFYRTSSGVRLCWELEEPKGPEAR